MGNLSPDVGTQFRTLIAAKDVPFSALFKSSSSGRDFNLNFDQFLAPISYRKGGVLETNGLCRAPQKFGVIADSLSSDGETSFRALIAAKDVAFSAPLKSSSMGPDFIQNSANP